MPDYTLNLPGQLARLLDKCKTRGLLGAVGASCKELIDQHDALKGACKKGRTSRTVSGVKKKGREGVLMARSWLLKRFPDLEPDDILVQTTSVGGSDLHFSPKARALFPFAPESKRVQSLNIWGALHQAEVNGKKKNAPPVLFFSRSPKGSEAQPTLYVAFRAEDLHAWLSAREQDTIPIFDRKVDYSNELPRQPLCRDCADSPDGYCINQPGEPCDSKDTDGNGTGSRDQVTPEAG